MKAISLTQPWATLCELEAKNIETRSWWTAHRGAIAIHAALNFPRVALELCRREPFRSVLATAGYSPANLPSGVVLCIRTIEDVRPTVEISRLLAPDSAERAFGDYSPGRFGFRLGPVLRRFNPPIPARGMLSLWQWDPPADCAQFVSHQAGQMELL